MIHPMLAGLVLATVFVSPASAKLQLPEASPEAGSMQMVGVTNISINYHAPAARGRKLFGKLVPWGEVWRAGANEATTIEFAHDVSFGGRATKAGKYALFVRPNKKGAWQVILNSKAGQWGAYRRVAALDVVAVDVEPDATKESVERLSWVFRDTSKTDTRLELQWGKTRISVTIGTDTAKNATANIKTQASSWREHVGAAEFLMANGQDWNTALDQVNKSIAINATWYNVWLAADLLAKKGDYKAGLKSAQRAWSLGEKADNFSGEDKAAVSRALKTWPAKAK